ncbi:spore gernimation protein [Halalkalibacillus sediminis]|uniref:Spore gernimation protein n=1 Tax=Halalkalibacillus sediminis TaxID=2018042 RepID=A0A2I0QUX8_9BACI|nr:endospore germination permease [Halalkalibacillus sediminis]PKR78094.1 spore gernimation protein [Halalkalibacillus sediminis]
MKSGEQVKFFYVILLIITSGGLVNHVIIIPALFDTAGRDAWLSIIFSAVALIPWFFLVIFISRKTNKTHLLVWLTKNVNKPIAYIVISLIGVYLFMMSFVTAKDLIIWTHITYLPKTPQFVLFILILIACIFLANTNLRTIAIVNTVLLPIIVILGFFVASTNLPKKDYSMLMPMFEHGIEPALIGMIFSSAGILEVTLILFIHHRIKSKIKYWQVLLLGFILAGLSLGPTAGGIATFGPEEMIKSRFPAFEQWQLVSLGRFIENLDFFSIYQWLAGALIRISLSLYLLMEIFHIPKGKKRTWILILLAVIIISANFIPINDVMFIDFLKFYYLPFNFIFLITLTLTLTILVGIQSRRQLK